MIPSRHRQPLHVADYLGDLVPRPRRDAEQHQRVELGDDALHDAAGDVAEVPNTILGGTYRSEHWNGAIDQGAAAARSMLGIGTDGLSFGDGVGAGVAGGDAGTDDFDQFDDLDFE